MDRHTIIFGRPSGSEEEDEKAQIKARLWKEQQHEEQLDILARKYRLDDWVNMTQTVPLSLDLLIGHQPWIHRYGLPTILLNALIRRSNQLVDERNRRHSELEKKYEMEKLEAQSGLKFMNQAQSVLSQYMH